MKNRTVAAFARKSTLSLLIFGLVISSAHADKVRRRACLTCGIPCGYRYRTDGPTANNPATSQVVQKSLVSVRLKTPSATGVSTSTQSSVVGFPQRSIKIKHVQLEQIAVLYHDNRLLLTGLLVNLGDADKHILRNRITVRVRGFVASSGSGEVPDGPIILEGAVVYWLDRTRSRRIVMIVKKTPQSGRLERFSRLRPLSHVQIELELSVPRSTVTSQVRSELPAQTQVPAGP